MKHPNRVSTKPAAGQDGALTHWWLNEPIGHLLKRAIEAVPPGERSELSSELLRFPLAAERDTSGPPMHWYNPGPDAYRFIRRSGNEAIFDTRVATFLHHLAPDGLSRREAAVRLLCLHEEGQLTDGQVSAFADALWKDVSQDSDALPNGTGLFSHAFLVAPAPPGVNAHARVYAHLFASGQGAEPAHLVMAVAGRKPYMQPSETDAVRLFHDATVWRQEPDTDPINAALSRSRREEEGQMRAFVLGIVAAPALALRDRTVERAKAALTFLDETNLPEALSALPIFYGLDADINHQIEKAFRRALAIGDRRATPAAVNALDRWLRLSGTNQVLPLPNILRDWALRALERGQTGGLASLIYLARRLIEAGLCGSHEFEQIVEVLDELQVGTGYGSPDGNIDFESERAVSLPLIRAECVRLARALEKKGVTTESVRLWRDLAASDPLPEVRNAARDVEDE